MMLEKTVKTLWQGKVSIPSKWIEPALKSGGLKVFYENQFMEFPPNFLKSLKWRGNFADKHGGKPYKLADIIWKPKKNDQIELF